MLTDGYAGNPLEIARLSLNRLHSIFDELRSALLMVFVNDKRSPVPMEWPASASAPSTAKPGHTPPSQGRGRRMMFGLNFGLASVVAVLAMSQGVSLAFARDIKYCSNVNTGSGSDPSRFCHPTAIWFVVLTAPVQYKASSRVMVDAS
jgi:hypothetical protein